MRLTIALLVLSLACVSCEEALHVAEDASADTASPCSCQAPLELTRDEGPCNYAIPPATSCAFTLCMDGDIIDRSGYALNCSAAVVTFDKESCPAVDVLLACPTDHWIP